MKPKPYVICHMCTTIDGRILTDRWGRLPGGQTGAALFNTTERKFGIPAWLVGTTTMREFASPTAALGSAAGPVERRDYFAKPRARRFAIGVDANGVLRFRKGDVNGDHVVLLITDRVSDDFLAHLQRAEVSYLFCGHRRIDLPMALRKIRRKLGLEHLLLEGGGTFNGAMLEAGLVDEISQVIVPVVDGGAGVTTLFEVPGGAARKAVARLRALSHRTLPGSIHWLRYRVVRRASRR